MSIFDLFKKEKPAPAQKPEQEPKALTDGDAAALWAAMKKKTAQPSFELELNAERVPAATETKIGGLPYWNNSLPVPLTPDGKRLALLAQLNMADFPESGLLPQEGILQFFIAADDSYGINFDKPTGQNGFRVVYHEKVDPGFSVEAVRGQFITPGEVEPYNLPYSREFAVDVKRAVSYMGGEDFRFMNTLKSAARELGILERPEYISLTDEELEKLLWNAVEFMPVDEVYGSGSRVLGYPYFTQWDIRSVNRAYEEYDVLLLQLDSEDSGNEWRIMWGDVGIGNFFIRKQALLNRDFSDVIYNWDCC